MTAHDGSGAWWLEGRQHRQRGGKAIPTSTVTFRFFKTGTDIPMGLTGIQTTFQDAEVGERFRGFQLLERRWHQRRGQPDRRPDLLLQQRFPRSFI